MSKQPVEVCSIDSPTAAPGANHEQTGYAPHIEGAADHWGAIYMLTFLAGVVVGAFLTVGVAVLLIAWAAAEMEKAVEEMGEL